MVLPYVDTWPSALAVAARPVNAAESAALLYEMVDELQARLGEDSPDFSFYTNRCALLSTSLLLAAAAAGSCRSSLCQACIPLT